MADQEIQKWRCVGKDLDLHHISHISVSTYCVPHFLSVQIVVTEKEDASYGIRCFLHSLIFVHIFITGLSLYSYWNVHTTGDLSTIDSALSSLNCHTIFCIVWSAATSLTRMANRSVHYLALISVLVTPFMNILENGPWPWWRLCCLSSVSIKKKEDPPPENQTTGTLSFKKIFF